MTTFVVTLTERHTNKCDLAGVVLKLRIVCLPVGVLVVVVRDEKLLKHWAAQSVFALKLAPEAWLQHSQSRWQA